MSEQQQNSFNLEPRYEGHLEVQSRELDVDQLSPNLAALEVARELVALSDNSPVPTVSPEALTSPQRLAVIGDNVVRIRDAKLAGIISLRDEAA